MADDLPTTVWSGEFKLGSVTMKCHVLSDGRRIIEAESVWQFFNGLGDFEPSELEQFVAWQRGGMH